MLTRRPATAGIVVVGGIVLALIPVSAALADRFGGVECDEADDTCEVEAGSDAEPGGTAGVPPGEGDDGAYGDGEEPPAVSDPGVPDQEVCESWIDETFDLDSDYRAGPRPSKDHKLMHTSCKYPDGTGSIDSEWVEVDEDGNVVVDPAVLAQQAVDALALPAPQIDASPPDMQLVNLPVWLWLEDGSWQEQTATASVPGTTVTAVAIPVLATWEMGDGVTETCSSAGTEWTESAEAESASPDCGHTYTSTSAGAPGGEYPVDVTVTWNITWSGGGESGTEPDMTTTAATSWPVAQSQAVGEAD